ncbi:AI-2E family transporter [Winogradskyella litorisediminis]|uniref:AI-2E family transporter n=1 Tax=Winogradskyella litorisediminis TaxID=1156618 RepID=A0ABW3N4Y1_9FLAO
MIKARKQTKSNLQTLAVLLGIFILLFILYKIRILLLFTFIAGVLTLICRPLVNMAKNYLKLSNSLSAVLALLLMISFVVLMVWTFFPIVIEHGKTISEIDFNSVKTDLNELNIQASEYLGVDKINFVEAIKETDTIQNLNSESFSNVTETIFDNFVNFIIGSFAVLFISFFLLRDKKLIPNAVTAFADRGKEQRFLLVLHKSRHLLTRYFVGVTIQTLLVAILYLILLLSMGIKNALAIAIVCAFLNIIPYLGPLISGVFIILIVVSTNLAANFSTDLLPKFIIIFIGVSIIQLMDNLFFQPVIFGQSVKSHPLEIFMVIFMGGLLLGIPGMILAVPVYTTLKVVSKEFLSEYKIVKHLTKNM